VTLWSGRFGGGPADELLRYTVSLSYDRRLAVDDLAGSRAHVRGLARGEILTGADARILLDTLDRVEEELATGTFVFEPGDEDIHTAVERRVTELAGDVGARLHTGRSRNDQIATDLRLFTKRELAGVARRLIDLQEVLLERARAAGDIYLPGYTHLQRAQPVLLAHHLLAHGWALARDIDRLGDTRIRLDVDRDFVAEALFDLTLVGVHLSRIGEEIVLWSSEEFGFVTLDDAYSTGSSMLPQKKNPDIAELARGKAGRLIGNLTGLLATLKGLPLSYNRDLQEDKEPLFDTLDQVTAGIAAIGGMLATATWRPERMRDAADSPAASAVDLAEWLVNRGMPFRQAHGVVGGLVRDSLERKVPLGELVQAHPDLGTEALELLQPGVAVTRRTSPGGAGPIPVARQLQQFTRTLESERVRFADA
jgi:argininosuccinate lyase